VSLQDGRSFRAQRGGRPSVPRTRCRGHRLKLSEQLPPFNKVVKAAITRQLTGRHNITLAG
jgi:hypothetical protein